MGDKAELLNGCWQKRGNFYTFSLDDCIYKTLMEQREMVKTEAVLLLSFSHSNHTTFNQSQSRATDPLKRKKADRQRCTTYSRFRQQTAVIHAFIVIL